MLGENLEVSPDGSRARSTLQLPALASVLLLLTCARPLWAAQQAEVQDLRCEYLINPLGIDVIHPRLSWVLQDPVRGARQTAFRVLVASTPDGLRHNRGDLWDTGKQASDRSIQVEYEGAPLVSYADCWWKAQIWDQNGRPSPWSKPAHWTMGILSPKEWKAHWIGRAVPPGSPAGTSDFTGARWIWYPGGDPHTQAPAGSRWFRRAFTLPVDAKIKSGRLLITADDRFTAFVNGQAVGHSQSDGEAWSQPQEIDVASHLHPGSNVLAVEASNDIPGPAGLLASLLIDTGLGQQQSLVTDGSWHTFDQKTAGWETAAFNDAAWKLAADEGAYGMEPWRRLKLPGTAGWGPEPGAPILRKMFALQKSVKRAVVSVCGLGYFELRLNGVKVGDHELDPAFTRYDKRSLYVTFDVSDRLHTGENVLGVMLGNGFYNQWARDAWNFQNAIWRSSPKLLLQMRLDYADGTHELIVSDRSWRTSTGPVLHDGIRNGEYYDARQEKTGWDRPHFDDSAWSTAELATAPAGQLRAQMLPPVKVMQTLRPFKLTEPKPGVFVFDMGQAFAGRARLFVAGPAGTAVTLQYGERLRADGTLERSQISSLVYEGPFQTETYVLKGQGREEWESRFTYHGYRYVEVTGFPGRPSLDSLQGRVMHTSFETTGVFECSNPLLNDIQRLTLWSYRSNFMGIPTDCPHREKNGWTGDAQLASEQAMYNVENAAAYTKWMNDFDDAQHDSGDLPGIVPTYDWGYGTGPAWDSAYLIIPWTLYKYRDDTRILAEHYPGMKRYVDYLTGRSKNHIVDYGLGDWVPYKTVTPAAITSTGYYFVDAVILSKAAGILGKPEDARNYSMLAEDIRTSFNKTFYHGDGVYANGSQTALSCALFQGLADAAQRPAVLAKLAANVIGQGDHLDTGILGAKYLFHSLSDGGQHELAYRVATGTTVPSYGDWIKKGATTLWEDWLGGASLDHIMFGDISGWFYETLAGITIDPAAPGFKHSLLKPMPAGDLHAVRASIQTPYGRLSSHWNLDGGIFRWEITIPANTTSTVWVPCREPSTVTESGRPAANSPGVHFVRTEKAAAIFEVQSGSYLFTAIDHQLSTIDHRPLTINHQPSTIDHRPSTIDHSARPPLTIDH